MIPDAGAGANGATRARMASWICAGKEGHATATAARPSYRCASSGLAPVVAPASTANGEIADFSRVFDALRGGLVIGGNGGENACVYEARQSRFDHQAAAGLDDGIVQESGAPGPPANGHHGENAEHPKK